MATSEIKNAVRQFVPRESKLLIAVSGGKDSMTLLHACLEDQRLLKAEISVAHLDHGLRENSAKDAKFVEETCDHLGLRFYSKRCEAPGPGVNLEAWGRDQRYSFFKEVINKNNLDWVLTAHTANDLAETLLIRLFAGKELRSIMRQDFRRRCLRPFLDVSRSEIEEYVLTQKLKYVEDESNQDRDFLRNKIRLDIIPGLESNLQQPLAEILSRQAQGLAADIEFIDRLVEQEAKKFEQLEFGSETWILAVKNDLLSLTEVLSWRLMQSLMAPKLRFNLGREASKNLISGILKDAKKIDLPGGFQFTRSGTTYNLTEK